MSIQSSINQGLGAITSAVALKKFFNYMKQSSDFQKQQGEYIDREIKEAEKRDEEIGIQKGMEYGPDRATMERLKAGKNPGEEVIEFEPGFFDRSQYNVINDTDTETKAATQAAKKISQVIKRTNLTEKILQGTPSEYMLEPKKGGTK